MILLAICLASFGLMCAQDAVGSSMMIAEARTLHRWPGLFDAANTYVGRWGVVLSAWTGAHYGLMSWELQVVLGSTMAADFSATNTVVPLAARKLPKENKPWPVQAWLRRRLGHREGARA